MNKGDVTRYVMTILIVVILALVGWNAFQDEGEMHEHHEFFNDVRAFMEKGDRYSRDDAEKDISKQEQRIERVEQRVKKLESKQ